MKIKLLTISLLLFSISGFSQKWVQFYLDKDIINNAEHVFEDESLNKNDLSIKIFKGEIFENIEKEGDIDFIVYGHSENELRCGSGYKQNGITLDRKDLYDSILKYKETFLRRKKGRDIVYKIDVSKLRKLGITDTIKFVNGNTTVISFKKALSDTIPILSEAARLIIPGYPSLFFNKDSLLEYEDPQSIPTLKYTVIDTIVIEETKKYLWVITEDKTGIYKLIFNNELKEKNLNKIPEKNKTLINKNFRGKKDGFWFYHKWIKENGKWVDKEGFKYIKLLWFLLALLPFLFYKLILKRFGNPIYAKTTYDGGSFEQYADKNDTTVKKLVAYNKSILSGYEIGEHHYGERNEKILDRVSDKELIIGYSFFNRDKETTNKHVQGTPDSNKDSNNNQNPSYDDTSLKVFITDQLSDIKKTIRNASSTLVQHQQEIENLTTKLNNKSISIKELEGDIVDKENDIAIKKEELEKSKNQSDNLREQYQELDNNLKKYSEKLLFTPYLEDIGKDYLKLLKTVEKNIQAIQNLIARDKDGLTPDEIFTLFTIAYIYPTSFNTGYWEGLFESLSKGFLVDPSLIQKLNDFQGDTDKIEFFKKYAYNNIWEPYINEVLLYIENMRIVEHFISSNTPFTQKIQHAISNTIETMRIQLKSWANLEVNYVSLLENYEKYAFTKLDNNTPTNLHKQLKVESEDIVQIISFGFAKNHGFENQDTRVIVK